MSSRPRSKGIYFFGRAGSVSDRRPETGDRRPETGDRRPETGDRRPETGDRRPETPVAYAPGSPTSSWLTRNFTPVWPRFASRVRNPAYDPGGQTLFSFLRTLSISLNRSPSGLATGLDRRIRAGYIPALSNTAN